LFELCHRSLPGFHRVQFVLVKPHRLLCVIHRRHHNSIVHGWDVRSFDWPISLLIVYRGLLFN